MAAETDSKLWAALRPPSCSFSRINFWGSLMFNLVTSVLPPVYHMLSTVYLAQIDSSTVGTLATYTYLTVIGKIINEGLPRASFLVLGDQHKDNFASMCTLMIFQMVASLVLAVCLCSFAPFFTAQFAAVEIQQATVTYIRISSWSVFFGSLQSAAGLGLRALDHPDIPMLTELIKVAINIILDFLLLSNFRLFDVATTSTQAFIRLCCDAIAATVTVVLYSWRCEWRRPQFSAGDLYLFFRFGCWMFLESVIRNCVYLACIREIVKIGQDYGAAWSNFNSIRWGVIMCVTMAADGSSSTFVGHRWHKGRDSVKVNLNDQEGKMSGAIKCSLEKLNLAVGPELRSPFYKRRWFHVSLYIAAPAVWSAVVVFIFEIAVYVVFYVGGLNSYALWSCGGNTVVADLTETMWYWVDWTYVLWAVTTQLTSVMTATAPKWTLAMSAFLNVAWILPWIIHMSLTTMEPGQAWKTVAVVFGGVNVLNILVVGIFGGFWLRENKKKFSCIEVESASHKYQTDLLLQSNKPEDSPHKESEFPVEV